MPKRSTDYRNSLLEDLKDPIEAAHYLNAALDDSPEMFLSALRDVAEARQMAKVAEGAGISRESLYRMLKTSGNPTYRSFIGILRAIGLEFAGVRAPASELSREPTGKPASDERTISVISGIGKRSSTPDERAAGSISELRAEVASPAFASNLVLPKKPTIAGIHRTSGAVFQGIQTGGSMTRDLAISGGR